MPTDTILQVSYLFSIYELWNAPSFPEGCSLGDMSCAYYPGRFGGAIFFIASFIWPHVKLLMLHLLFYFPMLASRRRASNYWVGVFGKWSFMDVLAMASIIGLFDLVIAVDQPLDKAFERLMHNKTVDECASKCASHTEVCMGVALMGIMGHHHAVEHRNTDAAQWAANARRTACALRQRRTQTTHPVQ